MMSSMMGLRSAVNILIIFMQSYADSSAAGDCLYCDGICLSWAFASFLFLIKIDQVRIKLLLLFNCFFVFSIFTMDLIIYFVQTLEFCQCGDWKLTFVVTVDVIIYFVEMEFCQCWLLETDNYCLYMFVEKWG